VAARTAGRRRSADLPEADDGGELPIADGLMARLADRIIENPAMSGGLMVMALTAAAVVSNALFLQKAHHPEPWFATRPSPVAMAPDGPDVTVPDPRPRAAPPAQAPAPRARVAPPAAAPPQSPHGQPVLIADLQRALSERGLYRGKIDGISGSRTRAAITAYEKAEGLPVTGEPSASVLDHITTASVPAAELPAQPIPPEAAAAAAPVPVPVLSMPEETVAGAPRAVERPTQGDQAFPDPPGVEAAPATVKTASVPSPQAPVTGLDRTRSVQRALNLIGYGPVPEDGVAGEETIGAIRRFELDHGLPITGAAGDTVVNRLVAIGALDAA
jgi:peptidoglycan hydrolase-like protein with peptidoglycan-binding domain